MPTNTYALEPRVAVLLTNNFEEVEAVTPIDVLRRAGVEVAIIGVDVSVAVGSRGVGVAADQRLADVADNTYDLVVLPGGSGAQTLREHPGVQAFLQRHAASQKPIAAICAAPIALARAGLLKGRRATCFPSVEAEITAGGATFVNAPVVIDTVEDHSKSAIITARGPSMAMAFSLSLVKYLVGDDKATRVAEAMLYELPIT